MVVWEEPITAQKVRKKIRRQQRGTPLRKSSTAFCVESALFLGNLCSQAGSYTVQIHHLLSEVRTLLQKRGNRNKVQEMQQDAKRHGKLLHAINNYHQVTLQLLPQKWLGESMQVLQDMSLKLNNSFSKSTTKYLGGKKKKKGWSFILFDVRFLLRVLIYRAKSQSFQFRKRVFLMLKPKTLVEMFYTNKQTKGTSFSFL